MVRLLGVTVAGLLAPVLVSCADAAPPEQAAPGRESPPVSSGQRSYPAPAAGGQDASRGSDREPRQSFLSIPEIGVRAFPVVRYRGRPDDAAGTRIQNNGPMASPRGPRGGVGPGEIGNLIITGHRTSHTKPFADLPSLVAGDRVRIRSGGRVHVYEITRTRWTSFRRAASRAAHEAPVPGRPGAAAVRPMITLSTCATLEDHAVGNYWSDRFGNPEHRIDKIGVLVHQRPA